MIVVNLSCIVILVLSVALWVIKKYQDGIFGRLGLCLMMFSVVVILGEQVYDDVDYVIAPEYMILVAGFALFLSHHFFRYLKFYHFQPLPEVCGGAVGRDAKAVKA